MGKMAKLRAQSDDAQTAEEFVDSLSDEQKAALRAALLEGAVEVEIGSTWLDDDDTGKRQTYAHIKTTDPIEAGRYLLVPVDGGGR
jgi:hypothetical protein